MIKKTLGIYILLFSCIVCILWTVQAANISAAENVPPLIDFIPPPPAIGEPDFERYVAIYHQTRSEKGSVRWNQATYDAEDKAHLEELFLDSFGLRINKASTPATHELLWMVIDYLAKTINPAKDHYKRIRPFAYFNTFGETCAPDNETWLIDNGAYPSGHSSRGWGLALVLAEISPERQGTILKRGYELGQSRVICGVHWQSDVESARLAAGVAIVQLHNEPEFLRLLDKAKLEIARQRHPEDKRADTHMPDAFVHITDLVPDILLDIRYYSAFNFVGTRIDGYRVPTAILARPAAEALTRAASAARDRGYILKIFDAYRPQAAVDHFVRWADDLSDQITKDTFYPEVDKSLLFVQNYIAARSGHSRGATVDLTLVELSTGMELDMGSPFDFFGPRSHHGAAGLTREQTANRNLLKSIMETAGFFPYPEEWWHYTLANEPYPDTYFNFPVQ